jgi:hypothetical protein
MKRVRFVPDIGDHMAPVMQRGAQAPSTPFSLAAWTAGGQRACTIAGWWGVRSRCRYRVPMTEGAHYHQTGTRR